eukprot:TRINITY_DN56697_c0_g1_i1.p4 TRINITY_DN56697_c0_g1~~TRINITY_DN56697_c0_g1_i1.p4  ORF type:complete len:113 (-),score=15.54 TRINITY_DN56697_c0_g1_i1:193-531(-)
MSELFLSTLHIWPTWTHLGKMLGAEDLDVLMSLRGALPPPLEDELTKVYRVIVPRRRLLGLEGLGCTARTERTSVLRPQSPVLEARHSLGREIVARLRFVVSRGPLLPMFPA